MQHQTTKWSSLLFVLFVVAMKVSQFFRQMANREFFGAGIEKALKSSNKGRTESTG